MGHNIRRYTRHETRERFVASPRCQHEFARRLPTTSRLPGVHTYATLSKCRDAKSCYTVRCSRSGKESMRSASPIRSCARSPRDIRYVAPRRRYHIRHVVHFAMSAEMAVTSLLFVRLGGCGANGERREQKLGSERARYGERAGNDRWRQMIGREGREEDAIAKKKNREVIGQCSASVTSEQH